MERVRCADASDLEQIRTLWETNFGDSGSFTDWFFTERFDPSLCSCVECDGRIVSALHGFPVHVRLRGRILPASMLSGVSTLPEYRGRGYMRQTFLHYMQRVRSQGVPVVVQTPAHLTTYFSRGHFPATDTRYVRIAAAKADGLPLGIAAHAMEGALAPLHACYQLVMRRYSGGIARSLADFAFKFRDYASDGAACFALWQEGAVRGYCVYLKDGDSCRAEEVIAADDAAYRTLLDALCYHANGRDATAKLPPDVTLADPAVQTALRPQGAMGVADVSLLLNVLCGDASLRFLVRDGTVPQNAGVWDGAGAPSDRPPHFTLEAGRLGQLMDGYSDAQELLRDGHIKVHDAGAFAALQARFIKLSCFIVDEY